MVEGLRDRCAIVGVGQTAYVRGTDRSTLSLHLEASLAALDDAGLTLADVDAVMPHDMAGRNAEDFIVNLGLADLAFTTTVHTGGASFLSTLMSACLAINGGVASCVLIPFGRRGYSEHRVSTGTAVVNRVLDSVREFERPYGNLVGAQWFAQAAQRHMHQYGTRSEHLGMIAVACRKHANLNENAIMFGRPMTLEDHQASRIITTPFHLFDCSLESDGAGAVVVTGTDRARDRAKLPVLVSGIGEGHGSPPRRSPRSGT